MRTEQTCPHAPSRGDMKRITHSLTHTLEVMNEVYVCIGEEYCDDRSVFDELSRYCGRQLDALTITE